MTVGSPLDYFLAPTEGSFHRSRFLQIRTAANPDRGDLEATLNLCRSLGGQKCVGVTWDASLEGAPVFSPGEVVLVNPDEPPYPIPNANVKTWRVRDAGLPPVWKDPTYTPPVDEGIFGKANTLIRGNVPPEQLKEAAVSYCRLLGRDKCKSVYTTETGSYAWVGTM
jgi:hypothetical protein